MAQSEREARVKTQIETVWKLAAADARADRDPQVLHGELGGFQTEYDDAYTAALLDRAQN